MAINKADKNKLNKVFVSDKTTLKRAMKRINDNSPVLVLLVVDKKRRLLGTITDGDIRRSLLKEVSLDSSVRTAMNSKPKYLFEHEKEFAKEFMKEHSITMVPILNKKKELIDCILWQEVEKTNGAVHYSVKDNTVFILAGGKGTRLDPFTKILPKPLIPIGDKPIIEMIMDKFKKYGFKKFVLSLNYKAEMIKAYFAENFKDVLLDYVEEKVFLGTAGSLYLLKGKIKDSVMVSNCDVIVDINFDKTFKFHKKNKNHVTIVGVVRYVKIPYGILEMKNGNLKSIIEKPEYDFLVNAGIYVIEPELLELIKDEEVLDMPHLLLRAKHRGYKIGVYPINSNWVDIGQREEYKQALSYFNNSGIL